jgi:hypothetical protein
MIKPLPPLLTLVPPAEAELGLLRSFPRIRKLIVASFVFCAVVQTYPQVPNESPGSSPDASSADTMTDSADDEFDHPADEDCDFWKSLAPSEDLQVVTWSIPDPKHVSLSERYGFCVAILHIPFGFEEHVIARQNFLACHICHMKWSPDSKFLLFTTESAGGHSPWHFRTFAFCIADKSFRDVEPAVGSVMSQKFHFEPPDVAVMIVQKGDSAESETKISLRRTMNDMPRIK